MASDDNRTYRVMVNMDKEEFERLEAAVARRKGRISMSSYIRDALDFWFAYRDTQIPQRGAVERHDEHPAENAPETAQDGPRSVCHLREV